MIPLDIWISHFSETQTFRVSEVSVAYNKKEIFL